MSNEENNSSNNNDNKESPKGYIFMIIFAILAIMFFIKFVFPAMEKGEEPPSSLLTGEVLE